MVDWITNFSMLALKHLLFKATIFWISILKYTSHLCPKSTVSAFRCTYSTQFFREFCSIFILGFCLQFHRKLLDVFVATRKACVWILFFNFEQWSTYIRLYEFAQVHIPIGSSVILHLASLVIDDRHISAASNDLWWSTRNFVTMVQELSSNGAEIERDALLYTHLVRFLHVSVMV